LVSSSYGYEVVKHKNKPIRWFQFHPEKHMEQNEGKQLMDTIAFSS
jgi:anthranilate/para-aminobenzoate synthase component II